MMFLEMKKVYLQLSSNKKTDNQHKARLTVRGYQQSAGN
jgi:hypothetical protein